MAGVLHARHREISAGRIGNVGKRPLDESGKYPVNENDEEISCADVRSASSSNSRNRTEEASLRAKRSNPSRGITDGWIASSLTRLAMTGHLSQSLCWRHAQKCPGQARASRRFKSLSRKLTPGLQPSCRAPPARRQDGRSARGSASTRHSRDRSHGRTPPRPDRRRARRKCRP